MDVAVIGLGRMGRRHIDAVRSLGLGLVAVCDQDETTMEEALAQAELLEVATYTEAEELLNRHHLDVLIIATTAPTHCPLVLTAAGRVPAILCEKPIATSLQECERMIEACAGAGTRLAINHQMRFMDQYTTVRELMESTGFGDLRSITVVGGNFGLAMNGVHYFELFRWLTNERVVRVTAWFSDEPVPNPRGPQFEDKAGAIRLELPSGKRMYMEVGADQGHGVYVTYAGRTGTIIADELRGRISVSTRRSEEAHLPTTRYGCPPETKEIEVAPADVIAPSARVLYSLLDGNNYPTGQDGRHALAVLMAAHISNERGNTAFSPNDVPAEKSLPIA